MIVRDSWSKMVVKQEREFPLTSTFINYISSTIIRRLTTALQFQFLFVCRQIYDAGENSEHLKDVRKSALKSTKAAVRRLSVKYAQKSASRKSKTSHKSKKGITKYGRVSPEKRYTELSLRWTSSGQGPAKFTVKTPAKPPANLKRSKIAFSTFVGPTVLESSAPHVGWYFTNIFCLMNVWWKCVIGQSFCPTVCWGQQCVNV